MALPEAPLPPLAAVEPELELLLPLPALPQAVAAKAKTTSPAATDAVRVFLMCTMASFFLDDGSGSPVYFCDHRAHHARKHPGLLRMP